MPSAFGVASAANRGDFPVGDTSPLAGDGKTVSHAARTEPANEQIDRQFVFKQGRGAVFALRTDPGPTKVPRNAGMNAQPQAAQKGVLGLFQIDEEDREMDDACGVRVAELNPAGVAKRRHLLESPRSPQIKNGGKRIQTGDDGDRERAASRAAIAGARDALVNANDPVAGNPRGSVTIVEFFDVRCPYCRKLDPAMDAFLAGDRDVRLVYKDLPILGPASVVGSKALLAARRQNGYDKLREALMAKPADITPAAIESEAKRLGLDAPRLLRDMEDKAIQEQIEANLRLAHRLGIQGTPAMVIGDELLPGAVDEAELKRAVAEARAARR